MAFWNRTNHANGGFKDNTPGGWVDTNGPVWWYGSDRAYLAGHPQAGRAAITRATNLIVNRVASVHWSTTRGDELWLSDPCRCRGDGNGPQAPYAVRQPRSVFWGAWIRSALSYGMGYLLYETGSDGQPLAGTMVVLDPLTVDTDPWQGDAVRTINDAHGRVRTVNRDGVVSDGSRLLELRNPTTPVDAGTGATPGTLAHHAAELGLIDSQLAYAAGMYDGSGVPSGYLKVNTPGFTQESADRLLAAWNQAHGSTRSTAVLSSTTEYQPIAMSPVDTALAEMKRLSLQDVANAFGIPGYLIGAPEGGSMTYSNVEMQMQALYEFTLLPWAVAVEETLSALLPGDARVQVQSPGERTISGSDGGAAAADGVTVPNVPAG